MSKRNATYQFSLNDDNNRIVQKLNTNFANMANDITRIENSINQQLDEINLNLNEIKNKIEGK